MNTSPDLPEPIYFGSGRERLFGWLHAVAGTQSPEWGLVLCKPFGYEAHCGHRGIRAFAEAAAALGVPALRFDYLGSGDSADIDASAEQTGQWLRDIGDAMSELRRRTGARRVCLLGFRLGALLATLAAREGGVDALALVAPVVSGRRYLKETRPLQLAAAAAEAAAAGSPGPDAAAAPGRRAGPIELSGHLLSDASIAVLERLEAPAQGLPGVRAALIIDRTDLPAAREWALTLAGAGVRMDYRQLPGFVEMMMTSPQFATAPEGMIEATRQWLSGLQVVAPAGVARAAEAAAAEPARPPLLQLPGEDASPGAQVTERPQWLDAQGRLFGVVTEPRHGETRRRAVIVPNNGAEYHVGSCRMNVALARAWARRGYYVLRMDLSGLGDSRTRPGRGDNEVFPVDAVEDIRVAIEFLRERYGVRDITLAGLCSGGYHSLRAAVAGLRVDRVLIVNPQNYFWEPGMRLDELQLAEVISNPATYRERLLSARAWKRFLTGRMSLRRVVRVYFDFLLLPLKSRLRDMARALGIRLRNDLGRELVELIGRRVRVVFIFSRGEPGIDLLRFEAGAVLKRLGEDFRLRIVDGADHTFSRSGPRKILEGVLGEELFAGAGITDPSAGRPVPQLRAPAAGRHHQGEACLSRPRPTE